MNFTPVVSNSNVSILRIQWTSDKAAQEKLSVIQCIATFQGSTIPCKTSIVTVNFSSNEQGIVMVFTGFILLMASVSIM